MTDYAMDSRLAVYLLDHSRPDNVVFDTLICKLNCRKVYRPSTFARPSTLDLNILINYLAYVENTTQVELRRFTDLEWESATDDEKTAVAKSYGDPLKVSPIAWVLIYNKTDIFGILVTIFQILVTKLKSCHHYHR